MLLSACAPVIQPAIVSESGAETTQFVLPTQESVISERQNQELEQGFSTNFSRSTVSLNEFVVGNIPKDGVPSIDQPQFEGIETADAWLEDVEPIMVVEHNGSVKGYPIQILIWHGIVNDEVGGKPLSITYCPLCTTSVVFERKVGETVFEFGVTGRSRYSNMVMYDRQTETWWQQATGEALVGKLTGEHLTIYPSFVISWGNFKSLYPEGLVLSRGKDSASQYGENPFPGYDRRLEQPPLYNGPQVSDLLPPMERILLAISPEETVAYAYSLLRDEKVLMDRIGENPVVVFWMPGTSSALDARRISEGRDVGSATAFLAKVNETYLDFEYRNGDFIDTQTGSVWNQVGQAIAGPLKGAELQPLTTITHFWFSTAGFYPDVRVFIPAEE